MIKEYIYVCECCGEEFKKTTKPAEGMCYSHMCDESPSVSTVAFVNLVLKLPINEAT